MSTIFNPVTNKGFILNTSSSKLCQEKNSSSNTTYVFKKDIANSFGVEAAILIQHFQYSVDHHKRNGTHFYEGRYWTYDSVSSLRKLYPFWSTATIRRIIKSLEDKGVLLSRNFNKHKYDRTKWFAFNDENNFIHRPPTKNTTICPNCHTSVDSSVDKSHKYVDNPVDSSGIKNVNHEKKNIGNQPIFPEKTPESRRNEHLLKTTNAFVETNKPIPIYSYIYNSSMEEGSSTNSHPRGRLKNNFWRKNTDNQGSFVTEITLDYKLSYSLRRKLNALGHKDGDIDREIEKMIRYHQEHPQIIKNEHSCVVGWFENSTRNKR